MVVESLYPEKPDPDKDPKEGDSSEETVLEPEVQVELEQEFQDYFRQRMNRGPNSPKVLIKYTIHQLVQIQAPVS